MQDRLDDVVRHCSANLPSKLVEIVDELRVAHRQVAELS